MNFFLEVLKGMYQLLFSKLPNPPEVAGSQGSFPLPDPGHFWSLDQRIADTSFTWRQALTQGNTGQFAIPTIEQENLIIRQAEELEKVFALIGGASVTSWLRTPEHNKAIGGASHSTHLVGAATDFIPLKMTVKAAKELIQQKGSYPGGGELNSDTWIHLDLIHTRWFFA